ncbi:rhodanese-related sulfurtransferase/TusA-related sulfurtransferase [Peribacillus deserti]|uniref:Rhodanese-related sulfurtransferase/TusA-related sulfurtransferase n=1 Tax=Peribacillus deserti TaxID=673318 RepID=A0ABS2QJK4_9BACI|nr:sulfurtransferase TusA family protein [Peribacillus deserti]MBM7693337.1 rhodanese-related sulfurtransferase/TusA-related sulfurtransferase [Peribacillus deserti]
MIHSNKVLDAKGLACPMPIVKTKKAMNDLGAGQVIEVQATDKGSTADLKAWAIRMGHHYLGTVEEGEILRHYVRKSGGEEQKDKRHPHVVSNDELIKLMEEKKDMLVLDVRESAEYAFNHIPNAVSVPLGELEEQINELDKEAEVYVVCRTGNRSDLAAQKLFEAGFKKVTNVVPGMSEWNGETEKAVK